jgi:hypothetical protein
LPGDPLAVYGYEMLLSHALAGRDWNHPLRQLNPLTDRLIAEIGW